MGRSSSYIATDSFIAVWVAAALADVSEFREITIPICFDHCEKLLQPYHFQLEMMLAGHIHQLLVTGYDKTNNKIEHACTQCQWNELSKTN